MAAWQHHLQDHLTVESFIDKLWSMTYVQKFKWLNPQQARWSLIFTWFDFILFFKPESENIQPDALSRHIGPSSWGPQPPAHNSISQNSSAGVWNVWPAGYSSRSQIQVLASGVGCMSQGLSDHRFSLLLGILVWSELFFWHQFWWPNMEKYIWIYLAACKTCALNKES